MRELNVKELEQVNGGADAVDAVEGAIGGAAAGATIAFVVSASNPITLGAMAAGALIGAAIEYFSE
ncbi:MAG: Blp family class II bacteriocin [Colwellia sp.]